MHPYDGRVVSNFILQALNGEDSGSGCERSMRYIKSFYAMSLRVVDAIYHSCTCGS